MRACIHTLGRDARIVAMWTGRCWWPPRRDGLSPHDVCLRDMWEEGYTHVIIMFPKELREALVAYLHRWRAERPRKHAAATLLQNTWLEHHYRPGGWFVESSAREWCSERVVSRGLGVG